MKSTVKTITVLHDGAWNKEEIEQMVVGRYLDRSGKRYGFCIDCHRIIRIDKPLFGSFHVCINPKARKDVREAC